MAQMFGNTESDFLTIALEVLTGVFPCCQTCLNEAEASTIDLYIVAAPLPRQRLRHSYNTRLGRRIVGLARNAVQCRNRCNVDDLTGIGQAISIMLLLSRMTDELYKSLA